jgi:hypothetical protein
MIPKERAIELVNNYNELTKDYTRGVSINEFAKECALIAVDELIKNSHSDKRTEYWQEVKHEINQL